MTLLQLKIWLLKHKYLLLVLLLVFLAEALFDPVEIILGCMMRVTNPFRPKVGRLWLEEEKDMAGKQQVTLIVDSLSNKPFRSGPIHNIDDLIAYVRYKNRFILSRTDFLNLYHSFADSEATKILDPVLLENLARDDTWQNTTLLNNNEQFSLIFNDGYGQPLLVSYMAEGQTALTDTTQATLLANDEQFKDRLIKPEIFLAAYERLPRRFQLQLVNDPALLTDGNEKLLMVALAPVVHNGSVTLACEMRTEEASEVRTFMASALAVDYLIAAIQELNKNEKALLPPQQEETL